MPPTVQLTVSSISATDGCRIALQKLNYPEIGVIGLHPFQLPTALAQMRVPRMRGRSPTITDKSI